KDLAIVFDRICQYNLKINPMKCAFCVHSVKFLGIIMRYRGIEVDPAKIKVIRDMPPPANLKQLQYLQG
ncbi:hypothetical protein, partial [Alteromonas stellipolaris]|uniref:hypothetical protein n=1 Tax=Alteromonas stellipolaris TaxID=233316 RepID=UPI001DEDE9E7